MQVRWLAAARADVHKIGRWIAKDDPTAAKNVVKDIRLAAKSLGQNPMSGHTGTVIDTRELTVPGRKYIIIYRVSPNNVVEILWVIHGQRDWPASFNLTQRLGDVAETTLPS